MLERIPWAAWKPLGPETARAITPTVLIFHTMVGSLPGTDSMFRQGGYQGTESTFGLGGPADGHDGELWQWQSMLRAADAQWDGNAYANSVETADGGKPSTPWSTKQLATLVRLTVDWCKATGNPCALVTKPTGKGLGYHEQFSVWNKSGHTCPGPVREKQLRELVIPRAYALLHPAPKPSPAPAPAPATPGARMLVQFIGASSVYEVVGSHLEHVTAEAWAARGLKWADVHKLAPTHALAKLPRTDGAA